MKTIRYAGSSQERNSRSKCPLLLGNKKAFSNEGIHFTVHGQLATYTLPHALSQAIMGLNGPPRMAIPTYVWVVCTCEIGSTQYYISHT